MGWDELRLLLLYHQCLYFIGHLVGGIERVERDGTFRQDGSVDDQQVNKLKLDTFRKEAVL